MSISSPVVSLNAGGSLLRLLEPLVLAVGAVLRLDQRRCLRHLFPVAVLKFGSFKNVAKETEMKLCENEEQIHFRQTKCSLFKKGKMFIILSSNLFTLIQTAIAG